MTTDKNPIANPIAVLRVELDDWAVLFNPDTAEAVGINPVGVAVWRLLDGAHSVEDIVDAIKQDFDEVSETAPEQVETFLKELATRGFMSPEDQEATT